MVTLLSAAQSLAWSRLRRLRQRIGFAVSGIIVLQIAPRSMEAVIVVIYQPLAMPTGEPACGTLPVAGVDRIHPGQ
jgi:hypothetical protein